MVELLIRAKSHWMDSLTQFEVDKMTPEQRQSYEARSQIGDIIVVRPDGWVWGKCECPPDFVVVKLKGVKEEDVKHYEQSLMSEPDKDGNTTMLKRRKYAINTVTVDICKTEIGGAKEIVKSTFDTKLITKTVSAVID